jgi:hypothetical protein
MITFSSTTLPVATATCEDFSTADAKVQQKIAIFSPSAIMPKTAIKCECDPFRDKRYANLQCVTLLLSVLAQSMLCVRF